MSGLAWMADTKTIIEQAYSAFNKRDIDGALAPITQHVTWPKASEAGKIVGKEEIRPNWTRQWGEFDPHVEPLEITEENGGRVRVRVEPVSSHKGCNVSSHAGSCFVRKKVAGRCLEEFQHGCVVPRG